VPASAALIAAAATHVATLIVYVGLVNEAGTELSGGSYARQPCVATATAGNVRLVADETFSVPAGTVAGWRAYSASTGGTDWGGDPVTPEVYAAPGQYVLTVDTGFALVAA
jgi:hypothetical protein